jgi:hypothetical protein
MYLPTYLCNYLTTDAHIYPSLSIQLSFHPSIYLSSQIRFFLHECVITIEHTHKPVQNIPLSHLESINGEIALTETKQCAVSDNHCFYLFLSVSLFLYLKMCLCVCVHFCLCLCACVFVCVYVLITGKIKLMMITWLSFLRHLLSLHKSRLFN